MNYCAFRFVGGEYAGELCEQSCGEYVYCEGHEPMAKKNGQTDDLFDVEKWCPRCGKKTLHRVSWDRVTCSVCKRVVLTDE